MTAIVVHTASGAREIILRVATALVLAPLGLWTVLQGGWLLAGLTALFGGVAAFEWVRMSTDKLQAHVRALLYAIIVVGASAAALAGTHSLEAVALASGVTAAAAALASVGFDRRLAGNQFAGAIYVTAPFGAFVWMRNDTPEGALLAVSLLVLVWATDIAAYFAGRGFGGPLLAPLDSPNKTWTGAIGAVVCACLAGASVARFSGGDLTGWLAASAVVSIVAQFGDLLESRIKRHYGVKDASGVVPGHGGVLDRLDALMAASLFAALAIRLFPALVSGLTTGAST